jgi:hypothetical protein
VLSATEKTVQSVMSKLRDQRERLLQEACTWRASATMLRMNSALMGFPEIAARMTALASRYDRLAEAAEDCCLRATGSRSKTTSAGLKVEIVGRIPT